jgi:hypothetical protein
VSRLEDYEARCNRYSNAAGLVYELRDAAGVCAALERCTADPGAQATFEEAGMVVRTLLRVFTDVARNLMRGITMSGVDFGVIRTKIRAAQAAMTSGSHTHADPRQLLQGASGVPTSKWFAYLKAARPNAAGHILSEALGGVDGLPWKNKFSKITVSCGGKWSDVVAAVGDGAHAHAWKIRKARASAATLADTTTTNMVVRDIYDGLAYTWLVGGDDE